MIAVDTHLLVYAHRTDSPHHDAAVRALRTLDEPWSIPWPCLFEFYSITTHPKIYQPPSTPEQALTQIRLWLADPLIEPINETHGFQAALERVIKSWQPRGGQVHDARIAAICLANGVSELWTADRDFSKAPGLNVRNPLTSGS